MMNEQGFPNNWVIGKDFDPQEHMMQLKGRDYLNVQNRLLWFIRDQRALIVAGLAKMPYIVQSDLIEMDRDTSFAHFKTYVRDVLGNEATMYGSENAKDFADYAEKASTKSLGRALLALGYGTAFAPEIDEGERVVDSPVEHRRQGQGQRGQQPERREQRQPAQPQGREQQGDASGITQQQWSAIDKLATQLGVTAPICTTQEEARAAITQLQQQYRDRSITPASAPAPAAAPDAHALDDGRRTTAEEQLKLVEQMRTLPAIVDEPAAEEWLNTVLGRPIRAQRLKAGESNITLGEIRRCTDAIAAEIASRQPNLRPVTA